MEAEQIINLFDSIWFKNQILQIHQKESTLVTTPDQKIHEIIPKTNFSKQTTILSRSKSDQFSSITSFSESLSPNSVLLSPTLQTIFSAKESKTEKESQIVEGTKHRRRKTEKGSTKSLTDLEFEELKGFMDLGFVFSEEDVNSSLVEIIPGLHRLGKEEVDTDIDRERPYLSEAWKVFEDKNNTDPLISCKISNLESEDDVKHRIKFWAHSVASAIR